MPGSVRCFSDADGTAGQTGTDCFCKVDSPFCIIGVVFQIYIVAYSHCPIYISESDG